MPAHAGRELIWVPEQRDIKVRHTQVVLGTACFVFRPLFGVLRSGYKRVNRITEAKKSMRSHDNYPTELRCGGALLQERSSFAALGWNQ